MKRLTILFIMMLVAGGLSAQQGKIYLPPSSPGLVPLQEVNQELQLEPTTPYSGQINPQPIGTVTTDMISAVKIGESSNAYSFVNPMSRQLDVAPTIGTGGGALGFIYRQNIATCGGTDPDDNGRYRYSFSTDGGITWNIGAPGTNMVGNPIPASGCYGIGSINPLYTRQSRYPQLALYQKPGSSSLTDLNAIYTGWLLQPGSGGWDNNIFGVVNNAADPVNYNVVQEDYSFVGADHYGLVSMTERVPGEFWSVTRSYTSGALGDELRVFKGTFDTATNNIVWVVNNSFLPNWDLSFDGATHFGGSPAISFDPTGNIGYIAIFGDLVGGTDSVYNPIVFSTTNGGITWSAGEEIQLASFNELQDSLNLFVIDDPNNPGTLIPASIGKLTTGFDLDMIVDKNGNPHILTFVGHGANAGTPDPGYTIFSGLGLVVVDITKDSFGDWSGMILNRQNTFRGEFGTPSATPPGAEVITVDPVPQLSRSPDASQIYMFWTDTDTVGTGSTDNTSPDLYGIGYDVNTEKLTTVTNFTGNDGTWGGNALIPHTSQDILVNSNIHTIPTAVMTLQGVDAIQPVGYWYFSDINFDVAKDFAREPRFFYNCKENPIAITVTDNKPNCGTNDGQLTVGASGGVGDLSFAWDSSAMNATTPTVTGLAAGLYKVTVIDTLGCSQTETIVLSNANAPVISVDSVKDIKCFGETNGLAALQVTGGTGALTFVWSNGENTATATMLPAGTSTLVVSDANSCETFYEVTIEEPEEIVVNTSSVNVLCNGDANGSASAVAFGGTGNLSYSWSNGATTQAINNVVADDYTLTIKDGNDCQVQQLISITQPDPIIVGTSIVDNSNPTAPFSGSVLFNPVGGVAPYSYLFYRVDTFANSLNLRNDTIGPSGSQANFFSQLIACNYIGIVTDANGCVSDTVIRVEKLSFPGLEGAVCEKLVNLDGFNNLASLELFPNPTKGEFVLNLELSQAEAVTIEVYDFKGQRIMRKQYPVRATVTEEISLVNETKGVYMVKVSTPTGSQTRRLILK